MPFFFFFFLFFFAKKKRRRKRGGGEVATNKHVIRRIIAVVRLSYVTMIAYLLFMVTATGITAVLWSRCWLLQRCDCLFTVHCDRCTCILDDLAVLRRGDCLLAVRCYVVTVIRITGIFVSFVIYLYDRLFYVHCSVLQVLASRLYSCPQWSSCITAWWSPGEYTTCLPPCHMSFRGPSARTARATCTSIPTAAWRRFSTTRDTTVVRLCSIFLSCVRITLLFVFSFPCSSFISLSLPWSHQALHR